MVYANELGIINYYKSKGDFNGVSIWKYIYDIKKKELVYWIYIIISIIMARLVYLMKSKKRRINAKCLNYWIGYKKLDEINNGSLEINDKLKEKGIYNYI